MGAYAVRHVVSLTTDASGDVVGYTPVTRGTINHIRYVKGDFANGVDFTVTAEITGIGIWAESDVNASATRAPRQATHAIDGTASLHVAAGEPVEAPIAIADERIKVVVGSGGDTKWMCPAMKGGQW